MEKVKSEISFNSELQKAIDKSYNKIFYSRTLDDLATALISQSEYNNNIDNSIKAVKGARHALARQGFSVAEIDDYLLEHSYLSKTQIKNLRSHSLEIDNIVIEIPDIRRPVYTSDTDKLIDIIKSKPTLLNSLKNNHSRQYIERKNNIVASTLLIEFYKENRELF